MYNYKRWMIGLDNSPMDKILLSYINYLTTVLNPDKLYFVHVNKDLDIPDKIRQEFPDLKKPLDEKIELDMQGLVEKKLEKHQSLEIEYEALEGNPLEQMLNWSHIKNIDLLIVGRKHELNGSGILPQIIARKIACSVLFVPEKSQLSLKNILVPIDFSNNSKLAFEIAIRLAEKHNDSTIYCHHTYQLPIGYYSTGKTEEEFVEIMYKHAVENSQNFVQDIEKSEHVNIIPIVEWNDTNKTAKCINNMAQKKRLI